jgi:hypothetical protein
VILWAAVSYALIERPFLKMRTRIIRPETPATVPFPSATQPDRRAA